MPILIDSIRKRLSELVDGMYSREAELFSLDIFSFSPALRFVEEFAESESELEDFRNYVIRLTKSRIYPDPTFEKWLEHRKKESRQRYISSGRVEDDEFLSLRHRYTKMEINDPGALLELKKPYVDEIQALREQENKLNALLASRSIENDTARSSVDLYACVMREYGKKFSLDRLKFFEHKDYPLYGKEIDENFVLGMLLDGKLIRQPMLRMNNKTSLPVSGASLGLSIRVIHKSEQKVKPDYGSTFGFEFFYPIREYPLGVTSYRYFEREDDLVALVAIYIKLFEKTYHEFFKCFQS